MTGDALPNVLVELVGRGDSLRTSADGSLRFSGVSVGRDSLRVRAIGYQQRVVLINVSADSGWNGTIIMEAIAQALPNVTVQAATERDVLAARYADFFHRRRIGQGAFRERADIERLGAKDIAAALQALPGLSVTATSDVSGAPEFRFRIARCRGQPPALDLYINGNKVLMFRQSMSDILSSINVSDIVFLEFYKGPSEIPADIDRGDACAVLIVWTR